MRAISLNDWIEQFKSRFDERQLKYMTAHKAKISLQLKDKETGEIHLHKIEFQSRDAQDLVIVVSKKEGKTNEQSL